MGSVEQFWVASLRFENFFNKAVRYVFFPTLLSFNLSLASILQAIFIRLSELLCKLSDSLTVSRT